MILRQAIPMGRGWTLNPRNAVTHAVEQDAIAGSSGVLRKLCLALAVSSSILAPVSTFAEEPKACDATNWKARAEWLQEKLTATEGKMQAIADFYAVNAKLQELAAREPAKPAALATPVQPQSSVAEQPKESDAKK